MIIGAHIVLYTKDPEADRAFFRDLLQLPSVDAGHGWLIFALPAAEAAFHSLENNSAESNDRHELFFMCNDIAATLRDLKNKNVPVSAMSEQRWGSLATLTLPSGGRVSIYQPKHLRPTY
jgi:catechol 2,3-dioxygenase-like lactoylglutathione lyase family enzyme